MSAENLLGNFKPIVKKILDCAACGHKSDMIYR